MRLGEVVSSSLEDRRGYLTLAIISKRDNKLLLRRTEGIKEWLLQTQNIKPDLLEMPYFIHSNCGLIFDSVILLSVGMAENIGKPNRNHKE